jgi:hypothetical protein
MPSRKMVVKPLLTQAMKDKRLTHWMVEDWKKVMFSAESHLELTFGNKSSRCRRPTGSGRLDLRFNKKSRKHLSKLMAWGYFSWKGRSTLVEEGGDDELAEVPQDPV